MLVVAVAWLFVDGIGVWGINIPVAWGFAIAEYVWWIALASGGTIVSALFYLTRSPWRAATNRIAETMLLVRRRLRRASCRSCISAGQGLFYWLFPYPNVMGMWPQFRSPLWWDFVCLLCYILMSIMFYYIGLMPDLATVRDLATTRGKQIFYGILALGWRGSARHWRNHQTVYAHHGGDHGADGGLGAQRRRPRFRRRAHPRLALDAVPALFLFRRGDLRHRRWSSC